MSLIADTHVHFYPTYDIRQALSGAASRLRRAGERSFPGEVPQFFLCLTERNSEDFFSNIASGKEPQLGDVSQKEAVSFLLRPSDGGELYCIAGRQIASFERLELCVLGVTEKAPERLSLEDAYRWAVEQNGIAVLNWSLGKWTGVRKKIVRNFLESEFRDRLFIGDILMRPHGLPEPELFTLARSRGYSFLAGSDPLPFRGEEEKIGRYLTASSERVSEETPWQDLSQIFLRSKNLELLGSREGLFSLLLRSLKYRLS